MKKVSSYLSFLLLFCSTSLLGSYHKKIFLMKTKRVSKVDYYYTKFLMLSRKGRLSELKLLLEGENNIITSVKSLSKVLFRESCYYDHPKVAEWLFNQYKPIVNVNHLLQEVCLLGNLATAEWLTNTFNATLEYKKYVLYSVIASGDFHMTSFIVKVLRPDIAKCRNRILTWCCMNHQKLIAEWFLKEQKVGVDVVNKLNRTALMSICQKVSWFDMVKWLIIEQKANIRLIDYQGRSVFMLGCMAGNLVLAKWLMRNFSIDLENQDSVGRTVSLLACVEGQLEVLQWLDSQNVNLAATDSKGFTHLMLATLYSQLPVMRWLVEVKGVDLAVTNDKGDSVLDLVLDEVGIDQKVKEWILKHPKSRIRLGTDYPAILYPVTLSRSKRLSLVEGYLRREEQHCMPLDIQVILFHFFDPPVYYPCAFRVKSRDTNMLLKLACASGCLKIAKGLLIMRGNKINLTYPNFSYLLLQTIDSGQLHVLKWLDEVFIFSGYDYRYTMNISFLYGHLNIIKWLIKDKNRRLPGKSISFYFDISCQNGYVDIVKWLLEKRYVVGFSNPVSRMELACEKGHLDMIEWMSDEGVVNLDSMSCAHYMCHAASYNQKKVIKWFIKRGVSINEANESGGNMLHSACRFGHLDLATWLVNSKGIDFEKIDIYGNSVFNFACMQPNMTLTKSLLALVPSYLHLKNRRGRTPFLITCWKGNLATLQWLVEKGANLKSLDELGNSGLMYAVLGNNVAITQWLVAKKLMNPLFFNKNHERASDLGRSKRLVTWLKRKEKRFEKLVKNGNVEGYSNMILLDGITLNTHIGNR